MATKKQNSKKQGINLRFSLIIAGILCCIFSHTSIGENVMPPTQHKDTIPVSDTVSSTDSVYIIAENLPVFPKGNVARWIGLNLKYPQAAAERGIQGKVAVSFIIERDGSVSNARVVKSVDPLLDAEALRVIRSMPKWKPSTVKGNPVRSVCTSPINFGLTGGPSYQNNQSSETDGNKMTRIIPGQTGDPTERMPQFTEGNVQKWISTHVKYPKTAVKNRIEGKVFIQFYIEKDGTLSNIKVLRSVSPDLDEEALRVVRSMPPWIPGIQKGKKVRVSYTVPINFRL